MRRGMVAVSAALSCMAGCPSALAEPADDPIGAAGELRIVYEASDECPDREAFLQEWLALRDPDEPLISKLEAGVVRVRLRRSGEEFAADLLMVDGAGQCGARRALAAPNCTELVADVAASLDLAIQDWTCAPPPERECPPPSPAPRCPAPPVGPPPPCSPSERRGEFGLAGGLLWFVPEQSAAAWGYAALLGYRSPRSFWGAETGPAWSVQLQVGYWVAPELTAEVPGADLDLQLRLINSRVSLCPTEVPIAGPWSVPLCGTVEAGVVLVRVGEEPSPERFWGAAGLAPRLRLSTDTLFTEVEPSVAFPLMRYRIQGGREIMNWVAPSAQIRLGVRF
jgi:hypothetical protein